MSIVSNRQLTLKLAPVDNARLANFCGPLDENIRQIEAAFDVTIARRGQTCGISGDSAQTHLAKTALEHFYALSDKPLSIDAVQLGLVELTRSTSRATASAMPPSGLLTRKTDLHGRTAHQIKYLNQIAPSH